MDAYGPQYVEEQIDLRYYLGVLRRHYRLLLSTLVISGSLAAIYAYKLPDIFQAQAQLLVERPAEQQVAYAELKGQDRTVETVFYNTQVEILKSPSFLERVVTEGELLEPLLRMRKVTAPEDLPEDKAMQIATGMVRSGLSVQQLRETRIITLGFRSTNRILCKEVLDAVAGAYIKQQVEEKLYLPKEILEFFPEDAQKLQRETPMGQLAEISREDLAKGLPSVENDPLIRQLKQKAAETEKDLSTARQTYKGKHPKVVELKSSLQFIQDQIKVETENIIRNMKATLTSRLQLSDVRVLKEATVPSTPVGPTRWRIILMASLLSAAGVGGLLLLRDQLDDTIKSQEDVEKFVQLPFLGHIPLLKEKLKDVHQKAFFVHYDPLSEVSEAFRLVKVAINFSGAPGTLKCLFLTSSLPSEGKSVTTTNLIASFLGDGEKVLLVDADLRHPTLHLLTNVTNVKGLSTYLASNLEFAEVVQRTVIPRLDVVPAGPLSPNPTELFGSYRMENFIREAKSQYDHVLIDSPPITGLADSLVIGTKVDGAILAIEARRVSRSLAKKTKQRMLETGIKILGVVITKIVLERDEPSYRYYAQSYRYYGKKTEASPEGGAASSTS
jgi:capsular exopolysaccharide synthesis family protein